MSMQDLAALAQSGGLVFGFVYLILHLPRMWKDWLQMTVSARESQAKEREADRISRHDTAGLFTRAVAETYQVHRQSIEMLTAAISDLRVASERICRYARASPDV